MRSQTLVFTDLDGTLLDHETYDFAPATPALAALAARGIPVILTTSKTFPEGCAWRQRLHLGDPFIIENGSALLTPADTALPDDDERAFHWHVFGEHIARIRRVLADIETTDAFRYRTLATLDPGELARLTGLDAAGARAAQARRFSEPLLWDDTAEQLAAFREHIARHGLTLTRGGRFHHVMGRTNKAVALARTREWYERTYAVSVRSIALGDSPNDAEMLNAADIAVIVRNDRAPAMSITAEQSIYTTRAGPAGWQEAFDVLLTTELA